MEYLWKLTLHAVDVVPHCEDGRAGVERDPPE